MASFPPFCGIAALASQTPHVHLLVALEGSSVQRAHHKERHGQSWARIQTPISMKRQDACRSFGNFNGRYYSYFDPWSEPEVNPPPKKIISFQSYFQVSNMALVSALEMSLGLGGMVLKDLCLFAILRVEHLQQIFAATPDPKISGGRIGAFHTQVRRSFKRCVMFIRDLQRSCSAYVGPNHQPQSVCTYSSLLLAKDVSTPTDDGSDGELHD